MTSDYLTTWLTNNYEGIKTMCQKITRGHEETDDLLHYSILHFMDHARAEELAECGQAMRFLSGIMWRSFHSSTSAYHTEYRQKGRVHSGEVPEVEEIGYDDHTDQVAQTVTGLIEELKTCGDTTTWYHATLFTMWLENPNYSQLSKQTGIPRTSISHAVGETKKLLLLKLNKMGITWNP
jgi:hypothetical protein